MRTDRELLELAAKAIKHSQRPIQHTNTWRPLDSIDQAKHIRHVLCLTTGFDGNDAFAASRDRSISVREPVETSKRAALCRAIVRAAAEIGAASQPQVSKGEEGNG